MLVAASCGSGAVHKRTFANTVAGRALLLRWLRDLAQKIPIVFAYEASGLGFGLYDEFTAAGLRCHVLAPSRIGRSPQQRSNKTDEKDALQLLEVLRAHYLAGNALPSIWIPDALTRDAREVLRARLDTQAKCSRVKTQIRTLLKRNGVARPDGAGSGWTLAYRRWLKDVSCCDEPLAPGARSNLASLLRQLDMLEQEVKFLDQHVQSLAGTARYEKPVKALTALAGVGGLTALVFLTELGDLKRFKNRRQIGAFLGVVPSAFESGESSDRKGRITRQGPARVRHVLCQAAWNRVRSDPHERQLYERLVTKNPKRKKKALVAVMRRLAIRMWHAAVA
jgi:transposase